MRQEITLIGKWKFVGAEKLTTTEWHPTNYVEGMAWEFSPEYFGESQHIGNITETTTTNSPINMAYAYNPKKGLLKIDIYTDHTIGQEDKSEADYYTVTPTDTPQTIKISIRSSESNPRSHFRYILQKVEC